MTSPTPTRIPPLSWTARLLVAGGLLFAFGLIVLAGMRTNTDGNANVSLSGQGDANVGAGGAGGLARGVEQFFPFDGAEILGQQAFGVDLEPTWLAELTLLPANGPAIALPEEEMTITMQLNRFLYQPQPDGVVKRLPGGTNCVEATIWNQIEGRQNSERVETWCFSVL